MMLCPKCEGKSDTIDSRHKNNQCLRRHKCKSCGFRFKTIEVYAKDYSRPVAYIK